MLSQVEEDICRSLASILERLSVGAAIAVDSDDLRENLSGLECLLTAILKQVYDEWKWEAIDGFLLAMACKTGPCEAEFAGLAILVSDQTVNPFHIRLQACAARDEIVRLKCLVGEPGDEKGGMTRIPYGSPQAHKRLQQLTASWTAPAIDWAYKAGFGQRQAYAGVHPIRSWVRLGRPKSQDQMRIQGPGLWQKRRRLFREWATRRTFVEKGRLVPFPPHFLRQYESPEPRMCV